VVKSALLGAKSIHKTAEPSDHLHAPRAHLRSLLPIASEGFPVQNMVHSLAVDTATHRVYEPEQQENGKPVARTIVYEAIESTHKR
jgi:hypothetical protein